MHTCGASLIQYFYIHVAICPSPAAPVLVARFPHLPSFPVACGAVSGSAKRFLLLVPFSPYCRPNLADNWPTIGRQSGTWPTIAPQILDSGLKVAKSEPKSRPKGSQWSQMDLPCAHQTYGFYGTGGMWATLGRIVGARFCCFVSWGLYFYLFC